MQRREATAVTPRRYAVNSGSDLLSQAVAHQVPSARRGLTTLFGMGRGVTLSPWPPEISRVPLRVPSKLHSGKVVLSKSGEKSRPRIISNGPLHALLRFHGRPINLVVYQDPYSLEAMGGLILRLASRLDAFSGYPIRT